MFFIGPIGETGSETRKRSDDIRELLIEPVATTCGFGQVQRADTIAEPGSITDQVIQHLIEDELVIADLHENNPNVFYELGVRHTTGKPCLLLAEQGDPLPFDVHRIRTIFLGYTNIRSWEKAKRDLTSQIKFLLDSPEPPDTNVTIAFDLLKLRRNQGLIDVFAMMEPTRPARKLIRSAIKAGRTWKQLKPKDRAAVDDLCRRFDLLGLYDRLGIVNSLHVDYIYSVPFVELYEGFLSEYVNYLRNGLRGLTHFWELVQFYERVRHVPRNHPAETGAPDWPPDPRNRSKPNG